MPATGQGKNSHRDRAQREMDFDFLIRAMHSNPDLRPNDYHEMLMNHVAERFEKEPEKIYKVTFAQTCRDIQKIKKNAVAHTGINLKSQVLDALEDYDYLISITMDQLAVRLNEDRKERKVIIEDITIKDFDALTPDEKVVYHRIRGMMKHTRTEITDIPAGSDIKDLVLTIAKLWKEKRSMLGIDAAKKVDTRNMHVHRWEDMTEQDIKDKMKIVGITNKKKLLEFIETIEFTQVKPNTLKNGSAKS